MKMNSIRRSSKWLAAIGICALVVEGSHAAQAQGTVTAQSLIDRQMILDQITRYYYNFGMEKRVAEDSFYADDGVLILGTRRYEGKEGVKQAYNPRPAAAPPTAAATGTPPATSAAPAAAPAAAPRERLPFNITIDNPLIIVHGDTATSQVIFTEYRSEKKGDPLKMTTQGKEFATWVKVKGQWLYKSRQISSSTEPPADWKE